MLGLPDLDPEKHSLEWGPRVWGLESGGLESSGYQIDPRKSTHPFFIKDFRKRNKGPLNASVA